MRPEVKEYLERDSEGRIDEEQAQDSQARVTVPERLQIQPEVIGQSPADPTRNSTVILLSEQGQSIVEEWRHDLSHNTQNPHDLELYFAGKVDQHNMMISLADMKHPEFREALPQQLDFAAVKAALEQEQTQRQQVSAGMPGFGI